MALISSLLHRIIRRSFQARNAGFGAGARTGKDAGLNMNDIGIGAVGAAIIAGLVSLLGLIIGKEQKVSEFRQSWIDELRKCLILYLVSINAIADAVRISIAKKSPIGDLSDDYKRLNEASHGIILRINDKEEPSQALKEAMEEFETIASKNSTLNLDNIRAAEKKFIISSKYLLKFEWKRVRRGEKTYFITKYIVVFLIIVMVVLFAILWKQRSEYKATEVAPAQIAAGATNQIACQIDVILDNAAKGKLSMPSRSLGRTQRPHASSKQSEAVCKGDGGQIAKSIPITPGNAN